MLRHLLAEDVELVTVLGEGSHCIRANRDQLEQILFNLALNARDAMPDGGTLTIETAVLRRDEFKSPELVSQLTKDEYVLLAVTDTGVGMGPETRARALPYADPSPSDHRTEPLP